MLELLVRKGYLWRLNVMAWKVMSEKPLDLDLNKSIFEKNQLVLRKSHKIFKWSYLHCNLQKLLVKMKHHWFLKGIRSKSVIVKPRDLDLKNFVFEENKQFWANYTRRSNNLSIILRCIKCFTNEINLKTNDFWGQKLWL